MLYCTFSFLVKISFVTFLCSITMFSPFRFLALTWIFLKTLGKLKFYVELHQKTANCCINIGNLSNYIVPRKHLSSFVYNAYTGAKCHDFASFPFRAHKLTDFSAFKMVYSPKTFLKNLFEMLINLTSPKWAQMVYVVNNLCWLAT